MRHLQRTPGLPGDAERHRFLARALIAIAALVSMMALAACGGPATPSAAPSAPAAPAASPAASPRAASPAASPGAASPSASAGGPAAMAVTVDMGDDLKYSPEHVTIKKGGTITWKNTSGVVHTSTDDPSKAADPANAKLPAGAKTWDSGNIDPGKDFTHTFDTPGDYTYFCIPHESAGMVGTITVQP
ncbi:cupredoxin domain-containing protein [Nitrolancea hollandica]|uniref:Plastocyanin (Modular protein) n=1 Tax=Nitrolancea hollandica Lb TaxID=1129897 RepID=I4EKJ1_9BACT|nr:plastocyanin/azurin family copper-binding protein [Nitrolancea hollandica]CCF85203.1 Plastocyanin (modular protein) [Nitrolancea hollandica Lb]